jgi:hypothetical protein
LLQTFHQPGALIELRLSQSPDAIVLGAVHCTTKELPEIVKAAPNPPGPEEGLVDGGLPVGERPRGGDEGLVDGGMRVTVADEDLVASAAEVAVTITIVWLETLDGAVNSPVEEILPIDGLRDQVTAVLLEPETVAVNCWL